MGNTSVKHEGEQYPSTQPVGAPLLLACMHLSVTKMPSMSPAHWLLAVQGAPVGRLLPPEQVPVVQVCPLIHSVHAWPLTPQAEVVVPAWQPPSPSQHPPHVPGPQLGATQTPLVHWPAPQLVHRWPPAPQAEVELPL